MDNRWIYFLLKPSRSNTLDGEAAFDFGLLPPATSTEFLPMRDVSATRPIRFTNLLTSAVIDNRLLTDFAVWSDLRPAVFIGEPLARFTGCFNLITFCVRCNAIMLGEFDCFECDDIKPSRARILAIFVVRFLLIRGGVSLDSISRISSSVENDTLFSPVSIRCELTYSSAIMVAALAGIFFTRITFCLVITFLTPSSCNRMEMFRFRVAVDEWGKSIISPSSVHSWKYQQKLHQFLLPFRFYRPVVRILMTRLVFRRNR